MTVGDYTGRDFDELKRELLGENVYLVKSASVYSTEYPYGAVISQSPEVGDEVGNGGAVYVVTSLGIEMARVPDLRYLSLEEAKRMLMESGLGWKIRYVVSPEVACGLVVEQKTEAGLKTPFGTEIELLVSAEEEGSEGAASVDITLSPASVTLAVNEETALVCSYEGNAEVIWSSSNDYIAEVDASGLVTAKHFGSVTISAAVDGNIARATVMVTDESIFSEIDDYLLTVGESVSLSSAIPESILSEVVWRSSCRSVADVDEEGRVTALREGYTDITASYRDQTVVCGITVRDRVTYIKVRRELLLGRLDSAEQVLVAKEIAYDIVNEYSDDIAEGNVTRITYVGYSDNDSFYITEGSKVTLRNSLGKNSVISLALKVPPTQTTYFAGDRPNYTGMVLTATYKDGSTADITKGYSAPSDALNTTGKQKLTVTYENLQTTVTITVNPVEPTSIEVSPSALTLTVGDTEILGVTFTPSNTTDRTVSSTSSDPSIVRADGLKLTALKAGEATVTVKSGGVTATCRVKVTLPAASSLSLSAAEMALQPGEEAKLTATVLPSNADSSVTWSTSDAKIASVDQKGRVTVVATGSAVITAKTANGKSATCRVQVSVSVVGIEMEEKLELKPGETHRLSVTVLPSNAQDRTLTWTSSDSKIASVDQNGKVKAIKAGSAQITATTANGKTATCLVSVLGECSLAVKTPPTKTEYYIGDSIAEGGLVLCYTDAYGKTSEITSGYELTYDTSCEGSQSVYVTYLGQKTSFDITVKRPSITLTKRILLERLYLLVESDPADVSYTWSSSNPMIFYFEGGQLIPVSSGSALACVTMVYNGIEYTATCPVTVEMREETNYNFSISCEPHGDLSYRLTVKSDIPDFDAEDVQWTVTGAADYYVDGELYVDCYSRGEAVTVNATYTYGGKIYSASYQIHIFEILREEGKSGDGRGYYYIRCSDPNFDISKVEWNLTVYSGGQRGGWLDGDFYVVDESGEGAYMLRASYTYSGGVVTAKYSYQW